MDGWVGSAIASNCTTADKKRSGRTVPLHPELRRALLVLRRKTGDEGMVIYSERGGARGMRQ